TPRPRAGRAYGDPRAAPGPAPRHDLPWRGAGRVCQGPPLSAAEAVDVLLVHGLGRTSGSMRRLGRDLRRAGHRPHYFTYFAWAESCARIVARLHARLSPFRAGTAPYSVIGHSLGGVLLRAALAEGTGRPPALLVLLGTPCRSPRMAQRALRRGPLRWAV